MANKLKPNLTEDQLVTFHEMNEKRLTLQRELDAVCRAFYPLAAAINQELTRCDRTTVKRGRGRATLVDVSARVSWKDEFIRTNNNAAAVELAKNVGTVKHVKVSLSEPPVPAIAGRIGAAAGLLFFLLCLPGCLKTSEGVILNSDASHNSASSYAGVNVQPAESGQTNGYTGAVVYCSERCPPCQSLVNDLRSLQKNGWTVGTDRTNDFILKQAPANMSTPRVVFYRNGKPVGETVGYSTNLPTRKALIRQILSDHPAK